MYLRVLNTRMERAVTETGVTIGLGGSALIGVLFYRPAEVRNQSITDPAACSSNSAPKGSPALCLCV